MGTSVLYQKHTLAISVKGKRSDIRTFKNGLKKEKFFPFTVSLPKKTAYFIGRHGKGAENPKKFRKIDVTSKTPIKTEPAVTETLFYGHKVDKKYIFISSEEGHKNMQNAICNEYIILAKKRRKLLKLRKC